jgi:hypothetical protein
MASSRNRRLPGVVLALGCDRTVREMDPGPLAKLLGLALFVLAQPCLFLLEDD